MKRKTIFQREVIDGSLSTKFFSAVRIIVWLVALLPFQKLLTVINTKFCVELQFRVPSSNTYRQRAELVCCNANLHNTADSKNTIF